MWNEPWVLAWWGSRIEGVAEPETVAPGSMKTGGIYYRECRYDDTGLLSRTERFVYQPGQQVAAATPPDVEAIARQVYNEVPLVLPRPHTAPPIDAEQLVGFPVWFWVDGAVWRSFEASAGVAGVSVSVVARPKQVVWVLGDGATLNCRGPGTAWNPGGGANQRSDCTHIYQYVSARHAGGRYNAHVTVVWSVTWSASTGQSGTLPDASRTTDFSLLVTERQAVISYGA